MRYQVTAAGTTYDIRIEQNHKSLDITVNGRKTDIQFEECADGALSALLGGKSYEMSVDSGGNGHYKVHWQDRAVEATVERGSPNTVAQSRKTSQATGTVRITTPMPGKIVTLLAAEGDRVKKGQGLVVVEAMKMQNEFISPKPGVIKSIPVRPGDTVEANTVLAIVEEES